MDDASVSVLDNIVRACEDNSIEVLFVSSPNAAYYPYAKAMEKYAEENGCIYLNLFNYVDEIDLDLENDFYDKRHMNNYGAAKVADFLS